MESFRDNQNQPVYYVAYLQPSGFVIVPADDCVSPIVAFADDGTFDPSPANPLGALVSKDLPGRMAMARDLQRSGKSTVDGAIASISSKWNRLERLADESVDRDLLMGLGSISDVRVEPLIQSRWSQTTVCGLNCYNYYTPYYYPCGCVATAMVQLMLYYQEPIAGIGVLDFTIYVDGYPETGYTRGGDGMGGPYNWSQMVLIPDCSITATQRQAIGALCFDAGVSVNMEYGYDGSGAYIYLAKYAFTETFGYDNSVDGWNHNNNIGAGLNGMVNPNLDAGYPALLGIVGVVGGHAIVVDGYGYNFSTLYHHLNMGWAGSEDAWYNLPNVDSSPSFSSVVECIYNTYTSGSGEIISGRVTDTSGNPIAGAAVTGDRSGGGTYYANTNNKGIYALAKIPSASTYTVRVTKTGYNFTDQIVTTGTSVDDAGVSGNKWGIDFVGNAIVAVEPQTVPYAQDFESGLPDETEGWEYYSSDSYGRIEVVNGKLRMDRSPSGSNTLNEAVLHLNLSGKSHVRLAFFQAESGDENTLLDNVFGGHQNGDGVTVSNDGVTWYQVVNATQLDVGINGQYYTVCLDDVGIAYTDDFQIKFQQYDNYPWSSDGREFDDIEIYTCTTPGDINFDCIVDDADLAILTQHWLDDTCPTGCEGTDLNGDGYVNLNDFAVICEHWLQTQ